MTTELVELADCPCCDSAASVQKEHGRDCSYTWIACTQCPIRTRLHAWMGDDDSIIASLAAAWNTRALASRAGGLDDELTVTRKVLDLLVASGDLTKERADAAESIMTKITPCVPDKRCRTYPEARAYSRGYRAGQKAAIAAAPEPVAVGS